LALYWLFTSGIGVQFAEMHNPPANGKQGPIPKDIYQTLLTNKKQENLNKYTPKTRNNHEKYIF
jgi:hypothetical protein